jgi:feruloyl esterase
LPVRIAFGLLVALLLHGAPAAADAPEAIRPEATAAACAALGELRLGDLRVESAEHIAPAPSWTPTTITPAQSAEGVRVTQPFCRVRARVEDEIQLELWMPDPPNWTGRFYGAGNGGFAGFIRYGELARGISRGMAAMSTDTGHQRTEPRWWRGHPRRIENLAFRGMHLATENAQAIARAYYGQDIIHSYFMGCSGGGMQAINEAARYPADYDGVVAGDHGLSFPAVQARMMLDSKAWFAHDPDAWLDDIDWKAIIATAVRACDAVDGVIDRPEQCKFDPGATPGLTPKKIATARAAFTDVRAADGRIVLDRVMPGSGRTFPSADEVVALFGEWLRGDAHWDMWSFNPARDITAADSSLPGLSLAGADLTLFQQRGGRLIGYQGGADPIVPSAATLRYYQEAARKLGPAAASATLRYFQIPGMLHCGGGGVPDTLGGMGQPDPPVLDSEHDLLSAIISWVEKGQAPDHLLATRLESGSAAMTRRIDAYQLSDTSPQHGKSTAAMSK